jgi:hypothetical protein
MIEIEKSRVGVAMADLCRTADYPHLHRRYRAFAALCVWLSASLVAASLVAASLVAASLVAASLATVTDARADASIVVDTSKTQSDCGSNCDDLTTLRNIFQDANIPAEPTNGAWLAAGSRMIADLNMKRARLLQSDVYCDAASNDEFGYTFNGTFTPGDCYPLLWQLQWAFSNNLSPHVAVASFMPPSFVDPGSSFGGSAETWSLAQLDRFRTYAYQLVNYIARKSAAAGVPSVVFEVSNEIDIEDSAPVGFPANPFLPGSMSQVKPLPAGTYGRWLWWMNPSSYLIQQWPATEADSYPYSPTGLAYPYNADVRRLDQDFSPLYQIFAQGVDEVRREIVTQYPNFQVSIAGPTMASFSFFYNPSHGLATLEEDFLDQILKPAQSGCASTNPVCNGKFNARLDRFAFHYYGSAIAGQPPLPLENITNTVKNKLLALGYQDVPLFLSEWEPSTNESTDVNYSHKGAAWAAAFLPEALKAGVQMGSYLILEDGLASGNPSYDRGQASLLGKFVASDGTVSYYPKPPANVFKMFAMMSGTRRPATVSLAGGSSSNLGAFVTSDTGSAHVIVYNYSPQLVFNNPQNTDSPENVSVELDNLPFNGYVTVTRYLVDSVTSNFEAFVANPTDPTRKPALQSVETFIAPVSNGKLILTPHGAAGQPATLGLGVTYWRVTE